tara:strand:+ start:305 stop:466 length:162 start_codon:yes stop_codon:yes gene_type:complete
MINEAPFNFLEASDEDAMNNGACLDDVKAFRRHTMRQEFYAMQQAMQDMENDL